MTDKPVYGPGEGYDPDPKPCHWPPHQRCQKRKTRTNLRCTQPRMHDQTCCRMHGGSSRQAKAAAARRGVEREARAALHRIGVEPVTDPLTALSQLAGQVVGLKDGLGELVNKLGDQIRYEDAKGAEQLRSELVVYMQALGECRQVLGLMARLDIDARLAAIEEAKAKAVVAALDAGLAAAGVTGAAATEARQVAARHLRSVA